MYHRTALVLVYCMVIRLAVVASDRRKCAQMLALWDVHIYTKK